MQHNKQYHRKVLVSSFHLNGHTCTDSKLRTTLYSIKSITGKYCSVAFRILYSLRPSSPIWASEVSLARTRERGAARSRVLERLASLAQIGELARRLNLVQCNKQYQAMLNAP